MKFEEKNLIFSNEQSFKEKQIAEIQNLKENLINFENFKTKLEKFQFIIPDLKCDCENKFFGLITDKVIQVPEASTVNNQPLLNIQTYKRCLSSDSLTESATSKTQRCSLNEHASETKLGDLNQISYLDTDESDMTLLSTDETLDKDILFSCSNDTYIKMWDLTYGKCIKTINGHRQGVTCVKRISNDKIVSGSNDKHIKIWKVLNGKCLNTLQGHSDGIKSLHLSQFDKNSVFSGSNKELWMWNLETGVCTQKFLEHRGDVNRIITVSRHQIASCSTDSKIKIWDLNSGKCVHTLSGDQGAVECILKRANNELVSSGSQTIKIWDMRRNSCLSNIENAHDSYVSDMQFHHNGDLISCSCDKTIKLWKMRDMECYKTLKGHEFTVNGIKIISENGLASCSDTEIKIWNLQSKENNCVKTFDGKRSHKSIIRSLD